jgi:uncharacterized protein (TIGR00159 family)
VGSILEPLNEALRGTVSQIRWTDFIDVVLVTVLVYTGLVWLRRTQAALVGTGILILGAVYLAARAFDLQLMAWIFQGFFAILVVIIVVIFQEELRQLFERLAVWALRRQGARVVSSDPTDILVGVLTDLARERIGALVVLPGSQPLSRHIQGGIELDGQLSVPLLKSIFDPHSPGHDGAVIVSDGKIVRFAVHLPLSKDFRQLYGVGTRHAAALGLAERSDALCIVVSEERGEISIARDGKLRRLQNPQELGTELQRFLHAAQPAAGWRLAAAQLLRANWREKVAAVILVSGLWYVFVPGSRPKLLTVEAPVRVINLPPGYVLESVQPDEVEVILSGPARTFYFFDSGNITANLDATLSQFGRRTFELTSQSIDRPADVTVELIRPDKVKLSLRKDNGAPELAAPPP